MIVRRCQDLDAWQLADAFKLQVFALVRGSSGATADFKFRQQLQEAARGPAKHMIEGFGRFSPGFMRIYLDYAVASLDEASAHIVDGIQLGYFDAPGCAEALNLARRCRQASLALKHSQRDPPKLPGKPRRSSR